MNRQQALGCRVWITRPVDQARHWADAVRDAGGQVLLEPLLEIAPPADGAVAAGQLAAAESADIVIATSANAVDGAWRQRPQFAPRGRLIAVGHATAAALRRATDRPVRVPAQEQTSEGLLAMPELALTETARAGGCRIAILAGEGGRRTLAETLIHAGAHVETIALYRRVAACIGSQRLDVLLDDSNVVVVTSAESLSHLICLAGRRRADALARLQLIAPGARVLGTASQAIDWHRPPLAMNGMDIDHLLAALALVRQAGRQ